MSCRIRARQCISATLDHNYEPRGVKTYAIFGSDRPFQRTFCDPRLSAHAVRDRRDPLPAFANLLGLYGRGDRAAWDLGGGRDGHCSVLRCHPWGTAGFDPVPKTLPSDARWWRPWTYAARVHTGQGEE